MTRIRIDFRFQHPEGRLERVRKRAPISSKAGAEEYERQLKTSMLGPPPLPKEVKTFSAFAAEFMKTYVAANNKPSERAAKACILKYHLLPAFGGMRLDQVRRHEILRAHRHLKSERVFCQSDGKPVTRSAVESALWYGCKRAGLRHVGSHALRHSFCSHLATRGAPPKAIQELAGTRRSR